MIKIIVTEDEIGKIYGCYKVIGIANDRISHQGQINLVI